MAARKKMCPADYKRGRVYVSRNPKAEGCKLRYVLYKPPAWVRTNNPKRWAEVVLSQEPLITATFTTPRSKKA